MKQARLALECAFRRVSVALETAGRILEPRPAPREPRAADLHPAIHALLAEAGLTARDIGEILLDRGPGSYTGLRIAFATARTFSFLFGTRIRCLLSCDLLAAAAARDPRAGGARLIVCLDARRGHWSAAEYALPGPVRLTKPEILAPQAVAARLGPGTCLVVCGAAPPIEAPSIDVATPVAAQIFGLERFLEDENGAGPLYLLPPL